MRIILARHGETDYNKNKIPLFFKTMINAIF